MEEERTEEMDSSIRNLKDREYQVAQSYIQLKSQAILRKNLHLSFVQSVLEKQTLCRCKSCVIPVHIVKQGL